MRPGCGRAVTNGFNQRSPTLLTLFLGKNPREIEVVPAYDGVLNQPPASLGDFLVFLFALDELVAVAERDGLGELVRALSFVELLLDGLPELEVVAVLQNKESLRDLSKFLQCSV
jgi:hypothetical protein